MSDPNPKALPRPAIRFQRPVIIHSIGADGYGAVIVYEDEWGSLIAERCEVIGSTHFKFTDIPT